MFTPQTGIRFNYNNISAENSSFWLTDEAVYYTDMPRLDDPRYAIGYHVLTESGTEKLMSAENPARASVFALDDMLYLLDLVGDNVYRLHRYDTETGEHRELARLKNVYSYLVVDQNLCYIQMTEQDGTIRSTLFVKNLQTGAETAVAEEVMDVGAVDGQLVYATRVDNLYSLYRYDAANAASTRIGQFCSSMDGFWDYPGSDVNFTSGYFLYTVDTVLGCYDLNGGQLRENHMEGKIHSVIAFEAYAFMVVKTHRFDTDRSRGGNVLYRVCLETGELEQLAVLEGTVETFVASDDCVYIRTSAEPENIYRYDANGEITLVCTF